MPAHPGVALPHPDGTADFRSDTVTRPTAEMRRAMAEAEVGDDVYGEDPTVNSLEAEAAAAVGKAAAVFTPSGSMANALALNTLTRPGDEVLCVDDAHIRDYEFGAASALSGVGLRTVATAGGVITVADVEAAAHPDSPARVTALAWENTHNVSGGTIIPIEQMEATSSAARRHDWLIHLDGARLFNAVVASGVPAARYAACADTVSFCFSKGLGAPVGSVLCGDAERMADARLRRRRLGGAMRQAGIVAAAARLALTDFARLAEDHALARRLAEGLAAIFPAAVTPATVETNMVRVDEGGLPVTAAELETALAAAGVNVGTIRPGVLRFVTHRDVDGDDVERVLAVARTVG